MKKEQKFLCLAIAAIISKPIFQIRSLPILLFILLASTTTFAQYTETSYIYHNNNLKHYATDYLPGTNEYVMAGTAFDAFGRGLNAVHLLRFNSAGTLVLNKTFYSGLNADDRVTGVHFRSANEIVIVGSRHDLNTSGNRGDVAFVMKVDANGNVISNKTIQSFGLYKNIYPMGTLINPNTPKILYICGYATPNTGTSSTQPLPTFRMNKTSFVLMYDLISDAVVKELSMESNIPTPIADFDIATRMKVLSNGNLFVTGSAGTNPNTYSGTLCLMLDPYTLGVLQNKTIVASAWSTGPPVPNRAPEEYGFDIVEAADGSGYYLFSNYGYVSDINAPMSPTAENLIITKVTPNFDAYTFGNSRAYSLMGDYFWGVNTIAGIHPDPSQTNTNLVLSGYQTYMPYPCNNGAHIYDFGHVTPYLTELDLTVDGSNNLLISPVFWRTLPTMAGTGDVTKSNSFIRQGSPFSSYIWAPITTSRDLTSGSTDIVLSAPVWDTVFPGKLNVKYIRTDENGQVPGGCVTEELCDFNWFPASAQNGPSLITGQEVYRESNGQMLSYNFSPNMILECVPDNYYRGVSVTDNSTTVITASPKTESINIYPNPANTYIQISLPIFEYKMNDLISLRLTDLTGKIIANLYEGNAEGTVGAHFSLGNIANGLYRLTIYNNGRQIQQTSITVQH